MGRDFYPDSEHEMLMWTANLLAHIAADPQGHGLDDERVAAYRAAQEEFAEAMRLAGSPDTRTSPVILRKNRAKRALEQLSRLTVHALRGAAGMNESRLLEAGVPPRRQAVRELPTPAERPVVHLERAPRGGTVRVHVYSPHHGSLRRRPPNVAGAVLYVHAGAHPPASIHDWQSGGLTTTTHGGVVRIPANTPPGTQVWVRAAWFNPRGQIGDPGDAAFTRAPFDDYSAVGKSLRAA